MALTPDERLPWHDAQWKSLLRRVAAQRLPHALMLAGPAGVGKGLFAERLARALLCTHRDDEGEACGRCAACQLYAAGTHPDIRRVAPEEEGKAIRIDAVRDAIGNLTLKSQYGGYKIALLTPADRMNNAAANALLKTLEEPAPQTLLVLVCARPAALPATVRSRCQRVNFAAPPREQALDWLQRHEVSSAERALEVAAGAPIKALELAASGDLALRDQLLADLDRLARGAGDPAAIAARYHQLDARMVYSWLLGHVADMIRLSMVPGAGGSAARQGVAGTAPGWHPARLFQYYDDLLNALWLADTQVNAQLLLEDLLIRWRGSMVAPTKMMR